MPTNWSCSHLARSTHKTSSKRSSSWFAGVRRSRLRSGRWTITLRRRPTSEWTPRSFMRVPRRRHRDAGSLSDHVCPRRATHHVGDLLQVTDRGPPARLGGEPDGGGGLGAHGFGCGVVTGEHLGRGPREPALTGGAPVEVAGGDSGGHG